MLGNAIGVLERYIPVRRHDTGPKDKHITITVMNGIDISPQRVNYSLQHVSDHHCVRKIATTTSFLGVSAKTLRSLYNSFIKCVENSHLL